MAPHTHTRLKAVAMGKLLQAAGQGVPHVDVGPAHDLQHGLGPGLVELPPQCVPVPHHYLNRRMHMAIVEYTRNNAQGHHKQFRELALMTFPISNFNLTAQEIH
jgi:hypothetical protein